MRKNSRIGGQAVLEGVMMRSPERMAIAVRTPTGISLQTKALQKTAQRPWYRKVPFVRGVVSFVDMLKTGIESLNTSAALLGVEEETSKFEEWVSKKTGKSAMDIASGFAMVVGLVVAVGLFFLLPNAVSGLFKAWVTSTLAMNLIDGALRLIIFLLYLAGISLMPDIKRYFAYHGAEHKVVNCYEHGELLTPENAARYSTRHPRCGTSFLLIVMVISVLIFALTGWSGAWYMRMGMRLALLPVVAAVSFEALMLLARWENWLMRALRWPGMRLQAMTTREPDESMLEVSIAAFAACLDEEERAKCMPPVAVEAEAPAEEAVPTLCEQVEEAVTADEPSQEERAGVAAETGAAGGEN